MLSFGDVVAIAIVYGVCWMFGALMGSFCKGIFGRFTMLVLTSMHISAFIAFVCFVGELSVLEMLEEIFEMSLFDGTTFCMIPTLAILGSKFGQKFRIRIERR